MSPENEEYLKEAWAWEYHPVPAEFSPFLNTRKEDEMTFVTLNLYPIGSTKSDGGCVDRDKLPTAQEILRAHADLLDFISKQDVFRITSSDVRQLDALSIEIRR